VDGGVASARFFYVFTKENMAINPGRREFLASIAALSLFPLEEETEDLRLALRRYRSFFSRLLSV